MKLGAANDTGVNQQDVTHYEGTTRQNNVADARTVDTATDRRLDTSHSRLEQGGGQVQPQPQPSSTDDASQTGGSGNAGYAPTDPLANDPTYQQYLRDQAKYEQAIKDITLVDDWVGGNKGDGFITMDDLKAAREMSGSAVQEAADRLLGDPLLRSEIDTNGDGVLSKGEVQALLKKVKEDIQSKRDGTKAPGTGATQGTGGNSGTGGNGETSGTQPKPISDMPPFVSNTTDPLDRTAEAIGHFQSYIDDLSNQLTNETEPGRMKAIEAKIQKATTAMQVLMSSMQQLHQMMSNIAKMYSDMAMAAIRNTH